MKFDYFISKYFLYYSIKMTSVKIRSIQENDDNIDLITILSEPKEYFTGLYPCINGTDCKLPRSRIILNSAHVDKDSILFHKKLHSKKGSKKKRYQRHITIKYNSLQWKNLKSWKKDCVFEIYLINNITGKIKKCPIIPDIPIYLSDKPFIIANDNIYDDYQSSFNKGAIQIKQLEKDLIVLKIMLEDAAFF